MKLILNNTAWEPARGVEQLFALADDPGELHNLVSSNEDEARSLRERVLRKLADRPGLRIRFSNHGSQALRGSFRASFLRTTKVKAPELPCSCIDWHDGKAAFTVPPGISYTLAVEDARDEIVFEGAWEDADGQSSAPLSWKLDPLRFQDSVGLRFDGSSWVEVARIDPERDTGIEVSWSGGMPIAVEAPVEADEELLQQLRALGYVN